MHSATLYLHDEEGRKCRDTPLATITVDDDAMVEIRMMDTGLLYRDSLENLGYALMWSDYPVTRPRPPRRYGTIDIGPGDPPHGGFTARP